MNLWGGRFTGETDKYFAAFNASFSFDRRLIFADLRACAVHARALGLAGVLQQSEVEAITGGLKKIGDQLIAEWSKAAGEDGPKVLDQYRKAK